MSSNFFWTIGSALEPITNHSKAHARQSIVSYFGDAKRMYHNLLSYVRTILMNRVINAPVQSHKPIASISTLTSLGNLETSTVARAGG